MADAVGLLLTARSAVAADDVGVGVELVDGLAVAVVVLGLADVDAFEDADELVVAVAEGEGSVLAVGGFEAVAVGVAVAEVLAVGSLVDGCGLGEPLGVAVGVGVAVGEEVGSGNGWHCCTAPVDAATAAVSSTGAAREPRSRRGQDTPSHDADYHRLYVRDPHERPCPCCSLYAVLVPYAPIGHQRQRPVLVHSYPPDASDHALTRMI